MRVLSSTHAHRYPTPASIPGTQHPPHHSAFLSESLLILPPPTHVNCRYPDYRAPDPSAGAAHALPGLDTAGHLHPNAAAHPAAGTGAYGAPASAPRHAHRRRRDTSSSDDDVDGDAKAYAGSRKRARNTAKLDNSAKEDRKKKSELKDIRRSLGSRLSRLLRGMPDWVLRIFKRAGNLVAAFNKAFASQ